MTHGVGPPVAPCPVCGYSIRVAKGGKLRQRPPWWLPRRRYARQQGTPPAARQDGRSVRAVPTAAESNRRKALTGQRQERPPSPGSGVYCWVLQDLQVGLARHSVP